MSLQVWLPLDGDTENLGVLPVTLTANNTTVATTGKTGYQSAAFSGSSQKQQYTLSTAVTSPIGSLACWVKLNAIPGASSYYELLQIGTTGGYANSVLSLYIGKGNAITMAVGNAYTDANYAAGLTMNTWYHICTTFDGSNIRYYVDGELKYTQVKTAGSFTNGSYLFVGGTNSYYFNGQMNDARYYNHVLSAQEVKQLAQGLVRHYLLNSTCGNALDREQKTFDGAQWSLLFYHNNKSGTVKFANVEEANWCSTDDKYSRLGLLDFLRDKNGKYEFMLEYPDASDTKYNRWKQTANPTKEFLGTSNSSLNATGYEAIHIDSTTNYWGGLTLQQANGGGSTFLSGSTGHSNWYYAIGCYSAYSGGGVPTANGWGDAGLTDYTKGRIYLWLRTDNLCQQDLIYDVAGANVFGTHGTPLCLTNPSPRYDSALRFGSATSNVNIKIPNGILPASIFSISWWMKMSNVTTNHNMPWSASGGSYNGVSTQTTICNRSSDGMICWCTWDSWQNPFKFNGTAINTNSYMADWHHYCATSDGSVVTLYVDGIIVGTATYKAFGATQLVFNGDNNGSYKPGDFSIVDWREYVTALSSADILELYNTSMSINSSDNISARILS